MRRLGLAGAATGLLCLAALAGCAGLLRPAIPPQGGLDHGLLVARVEVHGSVFTRSIKTADRAELVALDPKGVPIPGLRATTGLAHDGWVFFFGLPAGRYVLREASFPARGVRYRVKLAKDEDAKRAIDLKPGAAAYMGRYSVDSHGTDFGEKVVRAGIMIFHWFTPFLKRPVFDRYTNQGSFDLNRAEETKAMLTARAALKGTEWSPLVAQRLRELSAPEPAKTTGVVRRRELPLNQEPFLAWRDTLGWGEPRRIADAMAWRSPGGAAQIAVFFTTFTAPGFAGWDASIAELRRESASSVEDRGGLFEVRVATRTGLGARVTKYSYPEGTLTGSETTVTVTETVLVPDGQGQYTARLRAPAEEFKTALPLFREFLVQLVLGPPPPKAAPKQEAVMPFIGGGP